MLEQLEDLEFDNSIDDDRLQSGDLMSSFSYSEQMSQNRESSHRLSTIKELIDKSTIINSYNLLRKLEIYGV